MDYSKQDFEIKTADGIALRGFVIEPQTETRAIIQINKLIPAEIGAKKIEHFGYFRKEFKDSIWQRILGDINRCIK